MDTNKIMKEYLGCLETANLNQMLSLFSDNATVSSPLRGTIKAKEFYKDLFKDTQSSKITLLNIFKGEDSKVSAGHFRYDWVLSDRTPKDFECVDVFEFSDDNKIQHLRIIYDTYHLREAYENVRN